MLKKWLSCSLFALVATQAMSLEAFSVDGLYVKAGLGCTWAHKPKATCAASAVPSTTIPAESLKVSHSMPWVGAVGYNINDHWRAELALNYRSRVNYRLKDDGGEELKGCLKNLTTVLNVYYDFSKLDTVTPYFGAGFGCAFNSTQDAKWDTVTEGGHKTKSTTWNVALGVREEVSPGFWVDTAYRYTDLGSFRNSGQFSDGTYGASTRFNRCTAQELVLTLSYYI